MKKVAVILILVVVLLSMGSAYARWTDSTSVTVTARNAIIVAGITGRTPSSGRITYTDQGGAPSTSNPYLNITETITRFKYKKNGSNNSYVTYTITNTGQVPVTLDGLTILNKSVDYSSPIYTDTITIEYSLSNSFAGYSANILVTDFDSHTGVSFPNSQNNILDVGEYCTLVVTYARVTSGDKTIDKTELLLTITTQVSCSVSR